MIKTRIFVISVMMLLATLLFPDDSFDDLFGDIYLEENIEPESPVSISGEHEFIFIMPYINTDRMEEPLFNNTFTINYQGEYIEVVSAWELNIPNNEIIPDENYIKMTFGNTIFKSGYSIFSWGHADSKNPTDKLNSQDYSDFLDIEKIPALSLSVEQYFNDFSIEMIYIPVKTASLFSFKIEDKIPTSVIDSENITYKEINDIDKFVAGGRLNYYGIVDLSLSYIYNLDDFFIPEFTVNPTAYGKPLSSLVLKNQRVQQIGLSGKTVVDRFGLWLETNYTKAEISDDYFEWTGGFDFNFGADDLGYLNFQSFGKWTPGFSSNGYLVIISNTLQNIDSELLLGVTGQFSYKLMNDELEPELVTIYITSPNHIGSVVLKPGVNYYPEDSLSIFAGMHMVFTAEDSSLYKELQGDNSLLVIIKYEW